MVVLAHLRGGRGGRHGGRLRRGGCAALERGPWGCPRRCEEVAEGWIGWLAGTGGAPGSVQALLKQETTATLREDCGAGSTRPAFIAGTGVRPALANRTTASPPAPPLPVGARPAGAVGEGRVWRGCGRRGRDSGGWRALPRWGLRDNLGGWQALLGPGPQGVRASLRSLTAPRRSGSGAP